MNESLDNLFDESPKPDVWSQEFQRVFEDCRGGLHAFLTSRLTQASDADDCLQTVFIKMMQRGESVSAVARRAWLFRVAANEAALFWRRQSADRAVIEKQANQCTSEDFQTEIDAEAMASSGETIERIARAMERLPADWRRIVEMRIHHNQTFQQISDQLQIPLGTALTRMRRALDRIRNEIED